jgi:tetratricopeptide (TPR) repeat protein
MKKYVLPLLVAVIAITASLFAACAGDHDKTDKIDDRRPTVQTPDPTDVIGQDLMIALSKAKNYHHKARVYMSDGKIAEAIAALREILSLKFPAGAPEAEDVRNDARALLAKLLVSQNQIDEAMRVVQEGIAQSQRESFFVANLYTVKGEIHEARAATLDPNDPTQKSKIVDEKHAAIDSYDKSNSINTTLQDQLMGNPNP